MYFVSVLLLFISSSNAAVSHQSVVIDGLGSWRADWDAPRLFNSRCLKFTLLSLQTFALNQVQCSKPRTSYLSHGRFALIVSQLVLGLRGRQWTKPGHQTGAGRRYYAFSVFNRSFSDFVPKAAVDQPLMHSWCILQERRVQKYIFSTTCELSRCQDIVANQ